ncbi:NAD-dependent dehydratase [Candidatus Kuenenbacteria bacterium HGW-Kuenenbacteria-1]|uniref:UDP-glucuronate decarboxylase n=1 Tax=Candidatus Kuenenbacteria bacterium HGW-Kuenenbacteria-1 TaxID=2013812 RepID=A0A2N1UP48_9BACT|nr:MAG: NAD-dependent dehydratase [Candidatus Kuenenbacteria bacterium HGW-Kuenenbacteria-1]
MFSQTKEIFKKNILVTGGAGFIGSHLCEELLRLENVNIICLDNFLTGLELNIDHLLQFPNFEFIKHDIIEPINLELFLNLKKFKIKLGGIQEIYHLACPASPKEYHNHSIETLLVNSLGVKNILDLAIKYKAKLLHCSDAAIYGSSPSDFTHHFKEEEKGHVNPVGLQSCYNEGKRFSEAMVANYRRKFCFMPNEEKIKISPEIFEQITQKENLQEIIPWAKIVRIFNTYGPRMKLDDGRIIPDLIKQAISNEPMMIIQRKEEVTSFCYIEDIITGLIKIMDSKIEGPINLGDPNIWTIEEIAELIIKISGSSSKIIYKERPDYMSRIGIPNIDKAKKLLEWFPVISLTDGLIKTIEIMRASRILKPF